MKKKSFISFSLALIVGASAAPSIAAERIQSAILDRGKVSRLYMAPGLGSVVTLPCPIAEAFVGREAELTVKISPTSKRVLLLSLNSGSSEPTNVIVRCESKGVTFVFDIIPSKTMHQDVFEVRSSFGSPEVQSSQAHLTDSSNDRKTTASEPKAHNSGRSLRVITVQKPTLLNPGEEASSEEGTSL